MRATSTISNGSHQVHVTRESCLVKCARWTVNNKAFIALATLLTIYALVGDDCRLLATNKPADIWFNVLTLICIVVFTYEIVMSCLGKDDYILGFFMILDIVSTVTLLLDLSWVTEIVWGDGEDLDKMRSGRTARVGAKAGRVVRVIRLVRILKLYKTVYENASKHVKKRKEAEEDWEFWYEGRRRKKTFNSKRQVVPGSDDDDNWDDVQTVDPELAKTNLQESRVGKKLSEMTTRRVIILVLTMLLVLPFLRTESADSYPASAYYGADEVYISWREFAEGSGNDRRERYERSMLKLLYYHNWFTGRSGSCPEIGDFNFGCPSLYLSHAFWIGITSEDESQILARVNNTRLRLETVDAWNNKAANQRDIYNFGTMPEQVLSTIAGAWTACNEPDKGIFRYGFSLLASEIDGTVNYAVPCPSDLRSVEKLKFFPRLLTSESYDAWHFTFYFDARQFTQSEAMYGIFITVFICIVLCIASLYFSNDANKLVLQPVEHMIGIVASIRDDPLVAMKMADDEYKLELKEKAKLRQRQQSSQHLLTANETLMHRCKRRIMRAWNKCRVSSQEGLMETQILEKTIIKLGSLLALGFGEAGAAIIGTNLASSDSAGVNVMIPGTKVECIIGKARINDFSTATEVLQGNVMRFVNQIAEIVHGVVDAFHGAANKNNGDTFLLVWRCSGHEDFMIQKFADMSMIAFARVLAAVHRAPVLAAYRAHPGLQQRLGKNCRVNLSFGLHAGWAIEGAVGTEFKIDASYLSPNISIASSVEAATKVYSVPIIVSQAVVNLASDEMADKCRLIDRVHITGSVSPMCLYSLDLDFTILEVDEPRDPSIRWNLRERFRVRQFLEQEKDRKMKLGVLTVSEFEHVDILAMRGRYTEQFMMVFHMGFQNYIGGEWQVARRLLSEAQDLVPDREDGPCRALLQFMEDMYDFQSPSGWSGIRELQVEQ